MLPHVLDVFVLVLVGVPPAMCMQDTYVPDSATSSSCLLQNTHVLIDDSGMIHKEHGIGEVSRHSHQEVSLFEIESSVDSRLEMVSSMLHQTQVRCKQMQAHQFFLSRHTHGLENHLLTLAKSLATTKPKAKDTKLIESSAEVQAAQTMVSAVAAEHPGAFESSQNQVKSFSSDEEKQDLKAKISKLEAQIAASPVKGIEKSAEIQEVMETKNVQGMGKSLQVEETMKAIPMKGNDMSAEVNEPAAHILKAAKPIRVKGTKTSPEFEEASTANVVKSIERPAGVEETESTEAVAADGRVAFVNADATTAAPSDKTAPSKNNRMQPAPSAAPAPSETQQDANSQMANLNKLVDSFIENQSGSEDACHSKLLEARHQLNDLHDILTTLMTQVNSTENSLILYDKELQEKLRELQEIETWKDDELKKCKSKKDAAKKMFDTLTKELKEMHEIASPEAAMDLKGGTVSEQASQAKLSYLQERAEARTQRMSLLQEVISSENPTEAAALVPALVQSTQDAAHHFLICAAQHHAQSSLLQEVQEPNASTSPGSANSTSAASTSAPAAPDSNAVSPGNATTESAASPKECQEEKETLEKTYVKAYVELSRLTAEYSSLSKSTACEDNVNSVYEERAPTLQEAAEKMAKLSEETANKLKELRPHLDGAIEADKKLRKQIAELTEGCEDLPETISDLDKVRDAIAALSLCPGLQRPEFKMPRWVGKWVVFSQDAQTQDDKQQDSGMTWACNNAFKGSRAAEDSEIAERTILDMPVNNTGEFPLMGECSNCAGDDDETLKSGHARVCWFRGQPLNEDGKSGICAKGRKVIMCVSDSVAAKDLAAAAAAAENPSGEEGESEEPQKLLQYKWTLATVDKKCPGKTIDKLDKGKPEISKCKKRCQKIPGCTGFNRGKKGAIEAQCFFFSSCTRDTPKGKLANSPMHNVYFVSKA